MCITNVQVVVPQEATAVACPEGTFDTLLGGVHRALKFGRKCQQASSRLEGHLYKRKIWNASLHGG
jgi:hypothetical protein